MFMMINVVCKMCSIPAILCTWMLVKNVAD